MNPEVEDLHVLLDLALARGASLLTAGERLVVRRIRALRGPPASLYARLTTRVPEVFPVDTLPEDAVAALVEAGLCCRFVPPSLRLAAMTRAELREAAVANGLPRGGKRAELAARLEGRPLPPRAWVRVCHRPLVRRLEQWALLRRRPDRSAFVVARLGHVRWPDYPRTRGGALHPDRRHLLAWEALWRGRDALSPEALLDGLEARASWPSGGLDLRRPLRKRVLAAARDRERAGDSEGARRLYQRLSSHVPPAEVAVRVARTLEAEGRAEEAWRHLVEVRPEADGATRIALSRAGKRIAAQVRRGWAPDPPLRRPVERDLHLPGRLPHGDPRRRWGGLVVEEAVARRLQAAGRRVLHAEGPLWTTLFALLFAETYFLPIPGMLPVPFLSGPLDAGTPEFARRRADAVAAVLAAVEAGEAPDRVREADARYRGCWLAGAAWSRAPSEDLGEVARGIGPAALRAVLEAMLREGWGAARGLPDLVVLPGSEVRLADAFPARLPPDLVAVEVKGPGDSVRDEQAVWFDRLLASGVPVELWRIRPAP